MRGGSLAFILWADELSRTLGSIMSLELHYNRNAWLLFFGRLCWGIEAQLVTGLRWEGVCISVVLLLGLASIASKCLHVCLRDVPILPIPMCIRSLFAFPAVKSCTCPPK